MPNFLDYLSSGWTISITTAIDYTGSNGNYTRPDSLHFLGPQNQYENALINVGSVLEPYDSDRSFPVFGYGGIPKHMGLNVTSHCFPLNGDRSNPELIGIQGIVDCYRATLQSIELSGPTFFAPLLKQYSETLNALKG